MPDPSDFYDPATARDYVLGALSPDDMRSFEAALRENSELQQNVAFWQDALGLENEEGPERALQGSFLSQLFREIRQENRMPWQRRIRLWEFAIGGAVSALLGYALVAW